MASETFLVASETYPTRLKLPPTFWRLILVQLVRFGGYQKRFGAHINLQVTVRFQTPDRNIDNDKQPVSQTQFFDEGEGTVTSANDGATKDRHE
jgi:hypothetical protein